MAATGEKSSDNESASTQKKGAKGTERSASPLKKLWNRCGLNAMLLKVMFKYVDSRIFAFPSRSKLISTPNSSIEALALLRLPLHCKFRCARMICQLVLIEESYQYDAFALNFPTLGYLVAIMSVLSMCILPRAKFFQTMAFNILGVCIGSCIALLTCYCSVQARAHTSQPMSSAGTGASGSTQAVEYNSSASAVCGIWLFFNIMFANALRFSRPQLQTPVIMYSIFANVSVRSTNYPPRIVAKNGTRAPFLLSLRPCLKALRSSSN